MKRYAFFSVLLFLFLLLFSSIVYVFYVSRLEVPVFQSIFDENTDENTSQVVLRKLNTWQDKFLSIKPKDYSPAVETFSMLFDVDTSALQEKSKFYQLIIDKNDIYSLFCLKQTLNSFDIKYSIIRNLDGTDIFLDTDNKILLEQIQKALLVYDINTQLKEIWL
ncbi:hypothetical protein [uncultured Campylobacter sp.]|uniref:hypothetical protein n=1 Tax=uncultured Campylobacter sp. TaxID=218934 RepID=UPI0026327AEC|nr:hypothetical protein [uncultured Campylobacter sp.]